MLPTDQKPERKVSVFISVRADSLTAAQAQELEDKIRDAADNYPSTDVQASRAPERPVRV